MDTFFLIFGRQILPNNCRFGSSDSIGESWQREIFHQMKVLKAEEYFVYPQGVCRIRKPAYAGNGCAIFPAFNTAQLVKKIRCSAEDDWIQRFHRVSTS